ncbi:MAG: molybdate ABC transporter permease subunit [Bacteroidota bacterium]
MPRPGIDMGMDWSPILLSLKLALVTSLWLLLVSLPILYGLHFSRSRLKPVFKALLSLPLVLPPTVLGYYLLLAFRPEGMIGQASLNWLGYSLIFSFGGLVIGSLIFSLPFMISPIISALEQLPHRYTEAALTLGKSKLDLFFRILLPNVKGSIIAGMILSFAHTLGEFGVVLMIGGNLPGSTRVASIAIYQEVEAMRYPEADGYALLLLGLSLVLLILVFGLNRGKTTFP